MRRINCTAVQLEWRLPSTFCFDEQRSSVLLLCFFVTRTLNLPDRRAPPPSELKSTGIWESWS